MTKTEAFNLALGYAGRGAPAALARLLNIRRAAVAQWDDERIPELREHQIRLIALERRLQQPNELPRDFLVR